MTMKKRNRLRNGRKQAAFGADGAVMAAATLAAAGIGAAASYGAAAKQADAMEAAAETQAKAMEQQNENANKLQTQSLDFTKQQNERNRELQKEIQMNLQLLTGQQNLNDMKDAAKIQVKHGGSARKRLREGNADIATTSLRGINNNLPFSVTDGGGVIYAGTTPEGYDLYELIGNDHEHYHKTQGGKNKTGVGIKFPGGQVIEGEGNQNSNQGEFMLVTPDDAKFISKHSIKGYNPSKAVMSGVNPIEAFETQEAIKNMYGIDDDGKKDNRTPLRRMRTYGGLNTFSISPDLSLDFLAPVATAVVAGTRQFNQARNGRSLKCGGRYKAAYGFQWPWLTENGNAVSNMNSTIDFINKNSNPIDHRTVSFTTPPSNTPKNTMTTAQGNLLGAGINAGANLLGAGISALGNFGAAQRLAASYNRAGDILANAYGNLKTIDMSALDRNNYRAAHAMAALQAPIVHTGAERAASERSLQRNLARINRNTLSSAAAQNRSAVAEIEHGDRLAQIESQADKLRQGIIQENMRRLTETSARNAELDAQSNRDYTQAYLNLLQYNNDIDNERITGAPQSRADAFTQIASTLANMRAANANAFASAINTGGNAFGNAFATNAKMANELEMSRYGWTAENNLNYVIRNADLDEARVLYKRYKGRNGQYSTWATQLEDAFGKENLV